MIQLPPISTRTDTLFPDTTLVLSAAALPLFAAADERAGRLQREALEPETLLAPMGEGAEVVEDYRASGLSLRAHPLDFLRDHLRARKLISCEELTSGKDGRWINLAGAVFVRHKPGTRERGRQ